MREPGTKVERPTTMRIAALVALTLLTVLACGREGSDAVLAPQSPWAGTEPTDSLGSSTSTSAPAMAQPDTTVPAAPVAVPPVRPPAATPAELEQRTGRLPWPTDFGLSPAVAGLLDAFERGHDWTGTLVGIAFLDVPADVWRLCWAIDESLPVGCGSGLVLAAPHPAYIESPERFETQTSDSSDDPKVILSTSLVSVHGTFFADSALFVPSDP